MVRRSLHDWSIANEILLELHFPRFSSTFVLLLINYLVVYLKFAELKRECPLLQPNLLHGPLQVPVDYPENEQEEGVNEKGLTDSHLEGIPFRGNQFYLLVEFELLQTKGQENLSDREKTQI